MIKQIQIVNNMFFVGISIFAIMFLDLVSCCDIETGYDNHLFENYNELIGDAIRNYKTKQNDLAFVEKVKMIFGEFADVKNQRYRSIKVLPNNDNPTSTGLIEECSPDIPSNFGKVINVEEVQTNFDNYLLCYACVSRNSICVEDPVYYVKKYRKNPE